jgi:hypothetical protein
VPQEVKDMLHAATPKAAQTLIAAMDATDAEGLPDWPMRTKAADAILNKTVGKTTVLTTEDGKPTRMGLIFLPQPESEE